MDYRFSLPDFSRFQKKIDRNSVRKKIAAYPRTPRVKKSVEDHGEVPKDRGALVPAGLAGREWGDRQLKHMFKL